MFCTEAVLFVSKYVVPVNVSHDVAMYDVFHDLRADGGQGYGSIVTRGGLVAIEDKHDDKHDDIKDPTSLMT